VSSREVGWLIPVKDQQALTRALLEVIEKPERSWRVGENAQRHVRGGFSKEHRIDRLESLYAEILGSKQQ
jgi:glycosyltransferase involved in cell wall biosynthesis